MALMDDVEFYGRAVDAGEMPRADAIRHLVEAANGGLTERGAETWLNEWATSRERMEAAVADNVDALRALRNGRPIPEHVKRNMDRRDREAARRTFE